MRAKRGKSLVCFAVGFLLIFAALGLVAHNLLQDKQAESLSASVAEELRTVAGEAVSGQSVPSEAPMPAERIGDSFYIGVLRIPSKGLELPVARDWSYEQLRSTPCRYAGSAYSDDLVIAAHNYASHFGSLDELSYGDEVSFTDVQGNAFVYEVASIEKLEPDAVDVMIDSDYELTLFTCTLGGADRMTVRCTEVLA